MEAIDLRLEAITIRRPSLLRLEAITIRRPSLLGWPFFGLSDAKSSEASLRIP